MAGAKSGRVSSNRSSVFLDQYFGAAKLGGMPGIFKEFVCLVVKKRKPWQVDVTGGPPSRGESTKPFDDEGRLTLLETIKFADKSQSHV